MAEKKIGDIPIGMIFSILALGFFLFFAIDQDAYYNPTTNISSNINSIYSDYNESYRQTEVSLESTSHNTSTFSTSANELIDTRGTGQANIISKENPSTITQALATTGTILGLHPLIMGTVISVIIIVGVVLLFRFIRPGGV